MSDRFKSTKWEKGLARGLKVTNDSKGLNPFELMDIAQLAQDAMIVQWGDYRPFVTSLSRRSDSRREVFNIQADRLDNVMRYPDNVIVFGTVRPDHIIKWEG